MGCSCLLVTGVVVLCGGTLLTFITSSTMYWKAHKWDLVELYIHWGLYRWCVEYKGVSHCNDIDNPRGYVHGCRGLVSLAVILAVISAVLSFVHVCKVSTRTASKAMVIAIVCMCIIAATLLTIATIIYGVRYNDDEVFEDLWGIGKLIDWELGASFFLNIVATIALLVSPAFIWQSFNPEQQVHPQGGVIISQNNPSVYSQPGQVIQITNGQPPQYNYGQPPQYNYGQPPPFGNYGQPTLPCYSSGQPAPNNGQTTTYVTATSGQQPMAQGYGQPTQPQPYTPASNAAFGQPGSEVVPGNEPQQTWKNPPPPF